MCMDVQSDELEKEEVADEGVQVELLARNPCWWREIRLLLPNNKRLLGFGSL